MRFVSLGLSIQSFLNLALPTKLLATNLLIKAKQLTIPGSQLISNYKWLLSHFVNSCTVSGDKPDADSQLAMCFHCSNGRYEVPHGSPFRRFRRFPDIRNTHTGLCGHVFLTIYSPEDDKTCHSVKQIENGTAILEQTNILNRSNIAMQIILCHFSKTISDCTRRAEQ